MYYGVNDFIATFLFFVLDKLQKINNARMEYMKFFFTGTRLQSLLYFFHIKLAAGGGIAMIIKPQ